MMNQERQGSSCSPMTEREKLEWIVENGGDCKNVPFGCHDCPMTDMCMYGVADTTTIAAAKARLFDLDHKPWTKAEILRYLINHDGDDRNCDSEEILERAKVRLATGNNELDELVVEFEDWEDFDGKR